MKREIKIIVIHSTATPEGRETTREDVKKWHLQRGFKDIGYHYLILLDGTIQKGRDESTAGAHVLGNNKATIGVCYVGGTDVKGIAKDTRTLAQKASLVKLLTELHEKYPLAKITGHRDLTATACPSFDAQKEYRQIWA